MPKEEQNILAVLLDVKEHHKLAVSDELIKVCFEVQQQYQFDQDRPTLGKMEVQIENYLKRS